VTTREVLKDNLVLEDVPQPPCCITTLHSGFGPICLGKWALRKLARKYNRSIVRIKLINVIKDKHCSFKQEYMRNLL
jgi:hypothetical protein